VTAAAAAAPSTPATPAAKATPAKGTPAPSAPAARAASGSAPASPQPAPSRPAAAEPAGRGLSEQQLRSIYDRYLAAKTHNNESADISYEKLAGKVAAMVPELQKKHAGKQIDFEVVIREGRVALKPVVK
jgi:hypothetical protein